MHSSRHPRSRIVVAIVLAMALGAVVVGYSLWRLRTPTCARLEAAWARQGWALRAIATEPPAGRAGQTIAFGLADLDQHRLYLRRAADGREWLLIERDGRVRREAGAVAQVREGAELLLGPSGLSLFVDEVPVAPETAGWEAFWVAAPAAGQDPKAAIIPRLDERDDFMREDLEVHPYARVTAGEVRLAQRGGGMPSTAAEEADYDFQRAVNPFSIHTAAGGRLTYRVHVPERWGDTHVEACFYFGVPKTGHVVDRDSLPFDTDLLVAMGPEDGLQVAFGWSGAARGFVLQTRSGDGSWTVLERWSERRPPLTNWVKIALECRRGHQVIGCLDDAPVLEADLGIRLRGPFHIQGGAALAEFDDVRAWSLPAPPTEPTPLLIRSRQFAGKRLKARADPAEFSEWAASSHAFVSQVWRDPVSGERCAGIVTGAGILGDVVCESPALAPDDAPPGTSYRIGLYAPRPHGGVDLRADPALCLLRARPTAGGWVLAAPQEGVVGSASEREEPALVVARRGDQGGRFCVQSAGRWLPLSEPVPGPVHLAIIRVLEPAAGGRFPSPPDPARHTVRCAQLVHELFENAAVAWNWVDGAFRMDCRWACQDQWNFMACGSTGLPFMTSKRRFGGDQVHEAFMCLRAAFPWDAGDATFQYDPDLDRANKHPILIAANGWYNRHDLNLSFCSDGRQPLSGYCVVFGGEDNTVTRLLRRGVTVAESRRPEHLFPRQETFMVVHYPWWKFTVSKTGARIRVSLDDSLLFDYTDPEPLDGGHLGFWSQRNGFAISRISSMAETLTWTPQAFYVPNGPEPVAGGWRPLVRDTVSLTHDPETDLTRVTNAFGGGFFAVRHVPEVPVDLRQTPWLELPWRPGPGVRVSLHLEIGGKPYIVRLGDSPLGGIKAFLVPGSERGECFQLRALAESEVRSRHCLAELPGEATVLRLDLLAALRRLSGERVTPTLSCLTIGNSSQTDALLAGHGGNAAGASYAVGRPSFR